MQCISGSLQLKWLRELWTLPEANNDWIGVLNPLTERHYKKKKEEKEKKTSTAKTKK